MLQRVWATIETKEAKQGKSAAYVQQARPQCRTWSVGVLLFRSTPPATARCNACLFRTVCLLHLVCHVSETAADLSMLIFCAILALALAASSVSVKAQRKAPKKRSSRKAKPSGTKLCASRLPTLYHQRAAPLGTEGGDA